MSGTGHWVVLETGQGGGLPNAVHGPFWDRDDAKEFANNEAARARALGRRDWFQVGEVDIDEHDDE